MKQLELLDLVQTLVEKCHVCGIDWALLSFPPWTTFPDKRLGTLT